MLVSAFSVMVSLGFAAAGCFACFGACRWLDLYWTRGMEAVGILVLLGWSLLAFVCSVVPLSGFVLQGLSTGSPLPILEAVFLGLLLPISAFGGGGWLYLRCWNWSIGFWRGVRFVATYYAGLILGLYATLWVLYNVLPLGQPLLAFLTALARLPEWVEIVVLWYFPLGAPLMWWLIEHLRRGLDREKS